jgi:hypothetical protein
MSRTMALQGEDNYLFSMSDVSVWTTPVAFYDIMTLMSVVCGWYPMTREH